MNDTVSPTFGVASLTDFVTARSAVPDTVMTLLVPVMDAVTVSVAVMVRGPIVVSVAAKVPAPFVSVASAGSMAAPSEDVKWTVPPYDVSVAFPASRAVTVNAIGVPAVAVAGTETLK